MIDFVIPSVARPTLLRTIDSIKNQNYLFCQDKNWNIFVGFDGISPKEMDISVLPDDDNINYIFLKDKLGTSNSYDNGSVIGNAGLVRNEIISKVKSPNKWIGFVDDDDTITAYYLDSLAVEVQQQEEDPFDVCIFRMREDPGGERVFPPLGSTEIVKEKVGISFCVRKEFLESKKIKFRNSNYEDFEFLMDLQNAGAKIKVSSYVTYNVGF